MSMQTVGTIRRGRDGNTAEVWDGVTWLPIVPQASEGATHVTWCATCGVRLVNGVPVPDGPPPPAFEGMLERVITLDRRRHQDEARLSALEDAVRSLQEGENENIGCVLVSIEELTRRLGELEDKHTDPLHACPVAVKPPERMKDSVAAWAKEGIDSPLLPVSKERSLGSLLEITKDSTEVCVNGPIVWDFKARGVSGRVHEWKLITTTKECEEHVGDPNDLIRKMSVAHENNIREAMRSELQWLIDVLGAEAAEPASVDYSCRTCRTNTTCTRPERPVGSGCMTWCGPYGSL